MIYYIADLHLGDKRVFDLCGRNISIDDYNEKLIYNWNSKVKDTDVVYVLGDIAEYNYALKGFDIIAKLNGIKHLIVGNHDEDIIRIIGLNKFLEYFETVKWLDKIDDNGREVFLSHYPTMDWWNSQYGSYHVYGHIHNKKLPEITSYYKDKLAFNASSDVINHTPVRLDELITLKGVM